MHPDYWHKQDPAEPLYPNILWSRPENRQGAGKLLIIGGEKQAFAAPAAAYEAAHKAGAGTVRVLLPECLRRTLGTVLENCDYAPCTPSGSFSMQGLSDWLAAANWADLVLLAGDFGQNSETTILLEKFMAKHPGPVCISGDALDHFLPHPLVVLNRQHTIIHGTIRQLQRCAISAGSLAPIYQRIDLLQLVESLHVFSRSHQAALITDHAETFFVADNGHVSTTPLQNHTEPAIALAARSAVFAMQNPSKYFEAITSSVVAQ